jgi:hypothetical protein
MVILPTLAVAFAGIAGNDTRAIDKQIQAAIPAEAHVQTVKLPAAALHTLARHGEGSREIVKKLHVDGLIGGELLAARGGVTLRIVIYDAEGGLKSLNELPLAKHALSKDELEVVRSNMADDVAALVAAAPAPAPAPEPPAPPPPAIRAAPPPPKPAPRAPEPKAAPKPEPKPEPKVEPKDDENPLAPPSAQATQAKPVETADASADAVGVDEIEAELRGGGGGSAAAPAASQSSLHLGAAVGLGLTGRGFSPGPSTVRGYSSTPVPAAQFAAEVQPTARTSIAMAVDHTLQMATPVADGMAATSMSRIEFIAQYALTTGSLRISPEIGLGRRTFSIDSTDPSRTPDGEYNYAIVGASASTAIGSSLAVRGGLAFEPVVSGAEPTEAALGEASRWAFDVGLAVEWRVHSHVFIRATADYQRFAWSWDMAGQRGEGGAIDAYTTAALAVGAVY